MPRVLSQWPARIAILCDDRTPFLHHEWKTGEPTVIHPAGWELFDPVDAMRQLPVYDPTPGWHLFDGNLIIIEDDFPPPELGGSGATDQYYWHYEWEGSWRKPSSAEDLRFCQTARKSWYDA